MTINLQRPEITELKPRITVFGVGGGGGNAVNNMVSGGLEGVEFVVANTDSQALHASKAERVIQMGVQVTQGLGAGSQPQIGAQAAEECIDEIRDHLSGAHMAFVTAGMGGGTGTGAAPVVARAAREMGILTVGVVTKPFGFEGGRRMKIADAGIEELQSAVDTLIVIPNQNLFRVADEKTTLAEAFAMADQVLYEGVACITDLMVKEGLINLDFADVRSVMAEMGKAMMGTGEASGDKRAMNAAEAAIANPLLDETNMSGAQGLLISITGGRDMTLFELDEAASRIREEVAEEANIIMGATFDDSLQGIIRVSVVATGIEAGAAAQPGDADRMREKAEKLRSDAQARVAPAAEAGPQPMPQPMSQPMPAPAPAAAPAAAASAAAPSSMATPARGEPAKAEPAAASAAPIAVKPDAFSPEEFGREFESSLAEETDRPAAPKPAMPRTEDFPAHAQRELRATQPDAAAAQAVEERGASGLFSKLTRAVAGQSAPQAAQGRSEPRPQPRVAPESAPVSYAPQPAARPAAPASLDQHGRAAGQGAPAPSPVAAHPVAAPAPAASAASGQSARMEEDLEIPAFLRRSRG